MSSKKNAGRFDGFHQVQASVSKTCLVRFDNNRYSVNASAIGRPVDVHAYADRSSSVRMGGLSPTIAAPFAAAPRSTIPGITCQSLPASQAL
jgi:hypothetical protein